jgi:glycosyltransferase involved in cell wall biosynthesis
MALDSPASREVAASSGPTRLPREPRVLFVNHAGVIAGAEMVLLDVARGRGDTSLVFLFEDGPMRAALDKAGTAAIVSRRAGSLSRVKRDRSLLRAAPMLARLLATTAEIRANARDHDVVYANSQKAFVLAAIAARLAGKPLVWHLHDILSDAHFGAAQRKLVVWLANRFAKRVIVPSRATGDAFVAAGGTSRLVRVVANGLDIPAADRPSQDRAAARAEAGLPDGFLIGVFSRLAPWKGQHIALQALSSLPGARLVIVGDALFGEDAFAARLRDDATTLGLADRVVFLGHRTDVPALMRLMDVVVHPSIAAEPFGRTLVEAMLCRVPVVAANTGAVAEILDNGRAGTLVPPGDVAALAEALLSLHDRPAPAASRLDHAEARAKTVYGQAGMRAGIDIVLSDLMAGAAP